MGLIEVIVAIGIVSIIGVSTTTMISNSMKNQKGIQAKDQQKEISGEVRSLLSDNLACLNTLKNINPAVVQNVTAILDRNNAVQFTVNSKDRSKLLNYDGFQVFPFVADAINPNQGIIQLNVQLSKVGETGTAKTIRPDIILLKVKLDGAGKVAECFSMGTNSNGFWLANPGDQSEIYFPNNVAIGKPDATQKLDVDGSARIAGDIVVQGSIKIAGSLASTCDAGSSGSVIYSGGQLHYCDGSNWQTIAMANHDHPHDHPHNHPHDHPHNHPHDHPHDHPHSHELPPHNHELPPHSHPYTAGNTYTDNTYLTTNNATTNTNITNVITNPPTGSTTGTTAAGSQCESGWTLSGNVCTQAATSSSVMCYTQTCGYGASGSCSAAEKCLVSNYGKCACYSPMNGSDPGCSAQGVLFKPSNYSEYSCSTLTCPNGGTLNGLNCEKAPTNI